MKAAVALVSLLVICASQLAAGESDNNEAMAVKGAALVANPEALVEPNLNRMVRGNKNDKAKKNKRGDKNKPKNKNNKKARKNRNKKGAKNSKNKNKRSKNKKAARRQRNKNKKAARRGRNKNKTKGNKNKARRKNKKKSSKKGRNKQRKNKKRTKKQRKNKKGGNRRGNKKAPAKSAGRQACDLTCVINQIRKYVKYSNNLRQVKRIKAFVKQANGKADKAAAGEFDETSTSIEESTNNGSACNGGAIDTTTKDDVDTIKNCKKTAETLCRIALSTTDQANVDKCETPLDTWVKAFQNCYQNDPTCTCFDAIADVDTVCQGDFKTLNDDTKAKRKKCTNKDEKGSFSSCRKVQQKGSKLVQSCKPTCPSATTKAAGFRRHRNIFRFRNVLDV